MSTSSITWPEARLVHLKHLRAWRTLFSALEDQGLVAGDPARLVALPRPCGGRVKSRT